MRLKRKHLPVSAIFLLTAAAPAFAENLHYPMQQDPEALYNVIVNQQGSLLQTLGEDGLTVLKILEYGLTHSTEILHSQLSLRAVEATKLTAKGDFDTTLSASAETSKNRFPYDRSLEEFLGYDNSEDITDSAFLSLSKKLRTGTTLTTSADVTRYEDHRSLGPDSNSSTLRFSVVQPLLKGFGDDIPDIGEKLAVFNIEAERARLVFNIAIVANNIISNFWSYAEATEALSAYQSSQERLETLLQGFNELSTRGLYDPNERSVIEASLAERQSTKLAAENVVRAARDNLGRSLGVKDEERTLIPRPKYTLERPGEISRQAYEAYLDHAKKNRGDLLSGRTLIQGADLNLKKMENDKLPNLDVIGSVGKSRITDGNGLSDSFTSFYDGNSASNWAVGLTFSYPLENNAAEGAWLQEKAFLLSQQAALYDLERSISYSISEIYEGLESLRAQITQSETAYSNYLDLYLRQLADAESGNVSFFDLLQTEQNLTNTEISIDSLLVQYYRGLASFRFETGTLIVPARDDTVAFEEKRFFSATFFDADR
jgi:outer membrane protein TolC